MTTVPSATTPSNLTSCAVRTHAMALRCFPHQCRHRIPCASLPAVRYHAAVSSTPLQPIRLFNYAMEPITTQCITLCGYAHSFTDRRYFIADHFFQNTSFISRFLLSTSSITRRASLATWRCCLRNGLATHCFASSPHHQHDGLINCHPPARLITSWTHPELPVWLNPSILPLLNRPLCTYTEPSKPKDRNPFPSTYNSETFSPGVCLYRVTPPTAIDQCATASSETPIPVVRLHRVTTAYLELADSFYNLFSFQHQLSRPPFSAYDADVYDSFPPPAATSIIFPFPHRVM